MKSTPYLCSCSSQACIDSKCNAKHTPKTSACRSFRSTMESSCVLELQRRTQSGLTVFVSHATLSKGVPRISCAGIGLKLPAPLVAICLFVWTSSRSRTVGSLAIFMRLVVVPGRHKWLCTSNCISLTVAIEISASVGQPAQSAYCLMSIHGDLIVQVSCPDVGSTPQRAFCEHAAAPTMPFQPLLQRQLEPQDCRDGTVCHALHLGTATVVSRYLRLRFVGHCTPVSNQAGGCLIIASLAV